MGIKIVLGISIALLLIHIILLYAYIIDQEYIMKGYGQKYIEEQDRIDKKRNDRLRIYQMDYKPNYYN